VVFAEIDVFAVFEKLKQFSPISAQFLDEFLMIFLQKK